MAELADAQDLGSCGRPCRFDSCYPHQKPIEKSIGFYVIIHLSMAKYKINKRKFITFIIICLLLLVAIIFGISKIISKNQATKNCDHNYENGVCTICGAKDPDYKEACTHEYLVNADETLGACVKCGEMPADTHPKWLNSSTLIKVYESGDKNAVYPLSEVSDDVLVLVNKEYHVTKDYYPDDMISFPRFVPGVGTDETHQLRKVAAVALDKMFNAAAEEGINLLMRTGFRSYEYQDSLYNSYVQNHGEEEANKFSAKPGESEHQTGLAADLAGESQGYILSDYFGDTPEGKWVKENCYKYGFILRYTDGTLNTVGEHTGYIYEAWHVRYVGKEVAEIMHANPNWTLEQYLEEVHNPTNNYEHVSAE